MNWITVGNAALVGIFGMDYWGKDLCRKFCDLGALQYMREEYGAVLTC